NTAESVDFFDLKGDLESLLGITGNAAAYTFKPAEHPALHPGQTAGIYCGEELRGYLGALHPTLQQQLDIPKVTFVSELALDAALAARIPGFKPLSRFPEVRRDLAVLVDRNPSADVLLVAVYNQAGAHLAEFTIFDGCMVKGIDTQKKR